MVVTPPAGRPTDRPTWMPFGKWPLSPNPPIPDPTAPPTTTTTPTTIPATSPTAATITIPAVTVTGFGAYRS